MVLAHLLAKGFHAAHTARNSPGFDILARKNDRYAAIRVKTARGSDGAQWTAKRDGSLFLDFDPDDRTDFVVFVIGLTEILADVSFYIVPTTIVDSAMQDDIKLANVSRQAKGMVKLEDRENKHRALWFNGSRDRPFYGYDKRWAKYRDAWHLLEGK